MRQFTVGLICALTISGCGVAYHSPRVNPVDQESNVRVVPINPETLLVANRSTYRPKTLPAVFFQTAGSGSGLRGSGAVPEPVLQSQSRPGGLQVRIPPAANVGPYRIGVSDVILLATPQPGNTVEQLSGLLAAQNARQGYTVQDDGSIAIPNIGRVSVAGLTLEEAEDILFQRLVENQLDPTFSLEIAEFKSKRVSIGGAVQSPTVVPITLSPVFLDEALTAAGGLSVGGDSDFASIRIYRDGTLYQIPVNEYYSNARFRRLRLTEGDSVFVDTEYELESAQAYFAQQIELAQFRQAARAAALSELSTEIQLRRNALNEARSNYRTRVELDAVDRDYVYLTGEVETQARYALPLGRSATLADAIFDGSDGISPDTGNIREIYVMRASQDPREFGAVTAWQLDAKQASNFTLATRFELRPNDVVFIAEQPITRWNRVVNQITPSLISLTANALND